MMRRAWILVLLVGQGLWADDKRVQQENNGILNVAVQGGVSVLSMRNCKAILDHCGQASYFSVPNCVSSVSKYVSASQAGGRMSNQIAGYFGIEVRDLMKDKKVDYFLTDLENRLSNPKPFNLWTFTTQNRWVRNSKDPKFEAIKLLAVLLQRGDSIMGTGWGDQAPRIQSIIERIFARMKNDSIEPLPPPMKSEGRPFYHFYGSAYLANRLMTQYHLPLSQAAAAVWSVNQSYEENRNGKVATLPSHKQRDVYEGYAAVNFMFSKDSETYSGPTYDEFMKDVEGKKLPASFIAKIPSFCKDGWQKYEGPPIHVDKKLLTQPPELPTTTGQ